MRTDCKFYESRTYANGEVVRKCDLDLAPEAPWRCPADCPAFQRRTDLAWSYGSMVNPVPVAEPPGLDRGGAELLESAEEILNEAGPRILAEVVEERARQRSAGRNPLRRLFRRR